MSEITNDDYKGVHLIVPFDKVPAESLHLILEFVIGCLFNNTTEQVPSLMLQALVQSPQKREISSAFLWQREGGLLIPLSWIRPDKLRRFDGKWTESELATNEESDIRSLLMLRELWLKKDPEMFENTDYAPVVQTRDFGSLHGNLYLQRVAVGCFRRKSVWILRKEGWDEDQSRTFRLSVGF